MWGAKSGQEQLPPFPEPTHRGKRNSVNNKEAKELCVVDFPSQAAKQNALPMVSAPLCTCGQQGGRGEEQPLPAKGTDHLCNTLARPADMSVSP